MNEQNIERLSLIVAWVLVILFGVFISVLAGVAMVERKKKRLEALEVSANDFILLTNSPSTVTVKFGETANQVRELNYSYGSGMILAINWLTNGIAVSNIVLAGEYLRSNRFDLVQELKASLR